MHLEQPFRPKQNTPAIRNLVWFVSFSSFFLASQLTLLLPLPCREVFQTVRSRQFREHCRLRLFEKIDTRSFFLFFAHFNVCILIHLRKSVGCWTRILLIGFAKGWRKVHWHTCSCYLTGTLVQPSIKGLDMILKALLTTRLEELHFVLSSFYLGAAQWRSQLAKIGENLKNNQTLQKVVVVPKAPFPIWEAFCQFIFQQDLPQGSGLHWLITSRQILRSSHTPPFHTRFDFLCSLMLPNSLKAIKWKLAGESVHDFISTISKAPTSLHT